METVPTLGGDKMRHIQQKVSLDCMYTYKMNENIGQYIRSLQN